MFLGIAEGETVPRVLGAGAGMLYGGSAVYGFIQGERCRAAIATRARRSREEKQRGEPRVDSRADPSTGQPEHESSGPFATPESRTRLDTRRQNAP